jgi:hypothetical protein
MFVTLNVHRFNKAFFAFVALFLEQETCLEDSNSNSVVKMRSLPCNAESVLGQNCIMLNVVEEHKKGLKEDCQAAGNFK